MSDGAPVPVREPAELDAALDAPLAVLYKHSPYCGLSHRAAREVEAFMAEYPDVPVYLVDVVRDRPLSREIERRLEIRHESPQVIVVEGGTPRWSASHRGVTAAALGRQIGD